MDEDKLKKEALFRYGIISNLFVTKLNPGELTKKIAEISQQDFIHPEKGKTLRIKIRTLFIWLKKFRVKGIDGLKRKTRLDEGKSRAIPEDVMQKAIAARKDLSSRTDYKIQQILLLQGVTTPVKRSTLNRNLRLKGYSRRTLKNLDEKVFIRFESEHVNDLWIGDYHDKSGLLCQKPGKMLHLSLFIDCHSRYILHVEDPACQERILYERKFIHPGRQFS